MFDRSSNCKIGHSFIFLNFSLMIGQRVFISLGPSCMSAAMLDDAGFRFFSLPLDWCRSGSIQVEDLFLEIDSLEYYYRHMHIQI